MTVKVPLTNITDYVEGKLDQFARALVLEVEAAVKENNPVDTGRMAASWMIGQDGDTSGEPKPEGTYDNPGPPEGTNYKADGGEKVGHTYSIHNNLPYAEANAGYVSGFPPSWGGQFRSIDNQVEVGWLEQIKKDLQTEAPKLWDAVQKRRR